MKVDWSKAPEWATCYTEDGNGKMFWEIPPLRLEGLNMFFAMPNQRGKWFVISEAPQQFHFEQRPSTGDTE